MSNEFSATPQGVARSIGLSDIIVMIGQVQASQALFADEFESLCMCRDRTIAVLYLPYSATRYRTLCLYRFGRLPSRQAI